MTRQQLRAMHLAGTVSVPQTFPELGRLSFMPKRPIPEPESGRDLLIVEHEISPKLTITRTFFLDDVSAVFVPPDPAQIRLSEGTWLIADEILDGWRELRPNTEAGLLGIAYVREQAAAFMQVAVGMTAAESVEYYPPLPHDRSVDHYRLGLAQSRESFFCLPDAEGNTQAGTPQAHAEPIDQIQCLPDYEVP